MVVDAAVTLINTAIRALLSWTRGKSRRLQMRKDVLTTSTEPCQVSSAGDQ